MHESLWGFASPESFNGQSVNSSCGNFVYCYTVCIISGQFFWDTDCRFRTSFFSTGQCRASSRARGEKYLLHEMHVAFVRSSFFHLRTRCGSRMRRIFTFFSRFWPFSCNDQPNVTPGEICHAVQKWFAHRSINPGHGLVGCRAHKAVAYFIPVRSVDSKSSGMGSSCVGV